EDAAGAGVPQNADRTVLQVLGDGPPHGPRVALGMEPLPPAQQPRDDGGGAPLVEVEGGRPVGPRLEVHGEGLALLGALGARAAEPVDAPLRPQGGGEDLRPGVGPGGLLERGPFSHATRASVSAGCSEVAIPQPSPRWEPLRGRRSVGALVEGAPPRFSPSIPRFGDRLWITPRELLEMRRFVDDW